MTRGSHRGVGRRGRAAHRLPPGWLLVVVLLGVTGCAAPGPDESAQQAADRHASIGLHLLRDGFPEAAEQRFERALELRSDHPQALAGVGLVAEARGDLERALEHHRRARAVEPDNGALANNLGRVLCLAGAVDAGLEVLVELAGNADYARREVAWTNAALCAGSDGRWATAANHLEAALQHAPEFAPALGLRAEVAARRGAWEDAERDFAQYMERTHEPAPRALYWAVRTARERNQDDRARQLRDVMNERHPDSRYAARLRQELEAE